MSDPSQMNASQIHEDTVDPGHNSSAATTVRSSTQVLTSSPLSSLASATPSAPSSGNHTPEKKDQKAFTAASAKTDLNGTVDRGAEKREKRAFNPTESDFRALDYHLLDPQNAERASTALHTFLTVLEQATAPPPVMIRTPRQMLQSFLIQQQLIAGIPVDKIEPMEGPNSSQTATQCPGMLRSYSTPMMLTVSRNRTSIPRLPPAQFNGALAPLSLSARLPNLDWIKRAEENCSRQARAGANLNTTVATTSQSRQGVTQPNDNLNNTNSESAGAITDLSSYFNDPEEQAQITQFFAEHFSTGSGILVDESAQTGNTEIEQMEDEDTDSDYGTRYWSGSSDDHGTEFEN